MPKPDGTLHMWERERLHRAKVSYENAARRTRMTQGDPSQRYNESAEKIAFAHFIAETAKYGGYR